MRFLFSLFLCLPMVAQMTPKEVCAKFSAAVVGINAANQLGTGFLVSSDGYILTAGHVVTSLSQGQTAAIFKDGKLLGNAKLIANAFKGASHSDYAVLKIEQTGLPYLELAPSSAVVTGTDITVIGHPVSAGAGSLFCLQGTIASIEKIPGGINFLLYQGVSVKGISGSPLISRETGKVIGLVTLKLVPINDQLLAKKRQLQTGEIPGTGVTITQSMGGIDYGRTFAEIIDTLDQQLANGLGGAIGIEGPSALLTRAKAATKK
jgi:V8-like Glu-specific endopeptidase